MIGVFDSGLGGLTILREFVAKLPQYSYVYFADNKHAPYGEKSTEEILELTKEGVNFLFRQGATLVVLACNTASAVALRQLQQEWLPQNFPDRRLLGIVVPTVEQITGASWRHETPITTPISAEVLTIGVLATPITVVSKAYPLEIHKRNKSLSVFQKACPGLVEAIEQGDEQKILRLLKKYIAELVDTAPDLRAVLLGCTHYELVAPHIATFLPSKVHLYRQPYIVAASLEAYIARHTTLLKKQESPSMDFYTSSDPSSVSKAAKRYFGEEPKFLRVDC